METGNPKPGSNCITAMMLGRPDSTPPVKIRQKTCLWCGKELIGPSYKKFCDARCHDRYNNDRKAARRAEWNIINGPIAQNDKFLEQMFKKYPDKDWPLIHLENPAFDGKARCDRIIDTRSEFEGRRYLRYSIHENPSAKTFKILKHE
jgi:hypothetical protein